MSSPHHMEEREDQMFCNLFTVASTVTAQAAWSVSRFRNVALDRELQGHSKAEVTILVQTMYRQGRLGICCLKATTQMPVFANNRPG